MASGAIAQTVTPNLGLTLPAEHAPNWGPIINADLTLIDTFAGSAGTITSLSVGSLSPLFTTNVGTPTTTPAVTYSLSTACPHCYFGNNTGSTATPAYHQPTFSDISGLADSTQMPAFTGDATTSAGFTALTFATVNSGPGACGDATHVCAVVTNGKGLVLSQAAVAISGSGVGTVTSVALTVPSWLTVAGSPVTTTGTLAVTPTNAQTANSFIATPNGSTGPVGLRAIVAGDLPLGTNAAPGAVQCDNTTITCTAGVISSTTHGTITGSGTNGFIPMFNLSSTAIGNSHLDDAVSFASAVTSTENFGLSALGVATSSANFGTHNLVQHSSYWNGTVATDDQWIWFTSVSAGTNPAIIYQLTHTGTSGAATVNIPFQLTTSSLASSQNCSSTASPAVCVAASAGTVQVAAAATTLTVNTSVITAASEVLYSYTTAASGCSTPPANIISLLEPYTSAIVAGTSFTMTLPVAPGTNPACVSFRIIN